MGYGKQDGEFNPNSIKVYGKKIAIKKHEVYHERNVGGIFIPKSFDGATRLTKGEIISIGEEAAEETGLKIGDNVLYDHFSVFYDTHPVVITNYENIIFQLDEKQEYKELKNHIKFVAESFENIEKETLIHIPDVANKKSTRIGKIVSFNENCVNSKYFKNNKHIIFDESKATIVRDNDEVMTIHEDNILGIFK